MAKKVEFKHYIITRFNLGLYRGRSDEDSDNWMTNRMKMFERFTVPSVHGQTCKDYEWIIILDSKTNTKTVRRISSISGATIHICDWPDIKFKERDSCRPWLEWFKQKAISECNWAVQTRLDNDDSLAIDYIQRSDKLVERKYPDAMVIDFPIGIINDIRNNKKYQFDHGDYITPFCTLVEISSKTMGSVYYSDHHRLAVSFKATVKRDCSGPGWMMNVHGTNATNDTFLDIKIKEGMCRAVNSQYAIKGFREW